MAKPCGGGAARNITRADLLPFVVVEVEHVQAILHAPPVNVKRLKKVKKVSNRATGGNGVTKARMKRLR